MLASGAPADGERARSERQVLVGSLDEREGLQAPEFLSEVAEPGHGVAGQRTGLVLLLEPCLGGRGGACSSLALGAGLLLAPLGRPLDAPADTEDELVLRVRGGASEAQTPGVVLGEALGGLGWLGGDREGRTRDAW